MNRRVFFFYELYYRKCHIVAFREQSDDIFIESIKEIQKLERKSELITILIEKITLEYISYMGSKSLANINFDTYYSSLLF